MSCCFKLCKKINTTDVCLSLWKKLVQSHYNLWKKCSLTSPYSLRKTYPGAWRATWGQCWCAACRKQWGVAGPWCSLPASYCTEPPCMRKPMNSTSSQPYSINARQKKKAHRSLPSTWAPPVSQNNVLGVELHPVLQLLGDVLTFPLSQVGDDDPRVEAARVGSHPQLLDSLLFEVQEP